MGGMFLSLASRFVFTKNIFKHPQSQEEVLILAQLRLLNFLFLREGCFHSEIRARDLAFVSA